MTTASQDSVDTSPEASKDPMAGQVLNGRFVILEKLGEGGHGAVYKAFDTTLSQNVAVKFQEKGKRVLATLWQESRIMKRLWDNFSSSGQSQEHYPFPRLIEYGDFQLPGDEVEDDEEGNPATVYEYMVMDLQGSNLESIAEALPGECKKLPMSLVAIFGRAVLRALQDLHNMGYVHRDIKPSNICIKLGKSRQVIVVDLGSAKLYKDPNGRRRKLRENVALPTTSAFESLVAHERKDLLPLDDLWALFYTMLKLVDGRLVWEKAEADHRGELKRVYQKFGVYLLGQDLIDLVYFQNYLTALDREQDPDYDVLDGYLSEMYERALVLEDGAPEIPLLTAADKCEEENDERDDMEETRAFETKTLKTTAAAPVQQSVQEQKEQKMIETSEEVPTPSHDESAVDLPKTEILEKAQEVSAAVEGEVQKTDNDGQFPATIDQLGKTRAPTVVELQLPLQVCTDADQVAVTPRESDVTLCDVQQLQFEPRSPTTPSAAAAVRLKPRFLWKWHASRRIVRAPVAATSNVEAQQRIEEHSDGPSDGPHPAQNKRRGKPVAEWLRTMGKARSFKEWAQIVVRGPRVFAGGEGEEAGSR
ncbi:hypothetical protein HDU96_002559 [Phlyctochytrium bullatum]|nr:hypothetical protein HDU96_002559 [Phlyctochytrium bullatum]